MDREDIERALDEGQRMGVRIETDDPDYLGWIVLCKRNPDAVYLEPGEEPRFVRSDEDARTHPYRIKVVEQSRSVDKSDSYERNEDSRRTSIYGFSDLNEAEGFLGTFGLKASELNALTGTLHVLPAEDGHRITIIDCIDDPLLDNVDVYVDLRDGRRFVGTFFSLGNVAWLFEKNAQTGECASGLYLWATDMILVKELTPEVIVRTVLDLINEEKLETAFSQIHVEDPGGDNWNDFLARVQNQPENVFEGDGWAAVLVHPTAEQLPPHERKTPMMVDAYLGIDEVVHFAQFETLGCSIRDVGLYCRYVFERRWVNWVQVLSPGPITENDVRAGFDRITEISRTDSFPAFEAKLKETLQPYDPE